MNLPCALRLITMRPVVKLTVNKRLENTNIRHINPDMTDTYNSILDISLVVH